MSDLDWDEIAYIRGERIEYLEAQHATQAARIEALEAQVVGCKATLEMIIQRRARHPVGGESTLDVICEMARTELSAIRAALSPGAR